MKRFLALALCVMLVCMVCVPAFAKSASSSSVTNATLTTVVDQVILIIRQAALYIGIIICLWGVFQIILALRREDSDGISKQITTIVVGAALVGIGAFITPIYTALLK